MSVKHAKFTATGFLFGSSITASYQDILSMEDDADVLIVCNSLDQPVYLLMPNESGTVDILIPANCSFSLDLMTNRKRIAKGTIRIKAYSTLPSASGLLSIIAVR